MINRKTSSYLIALGLCLIIGLSEGQDWLVGGYVSSYGPYDDPSIFGLKRWLDYPYPTYSLYTAEGSAYSLPYAAYTYYPSYYYSAAGWTPIYGAGWQVYSKDWAKTLEYAQTRSSIRVYPLGAVAYTPSPPAATTISVGPTGMQTATAPAAPTAAPTTPPAAPAAAPTTSPAASEYYSPEYASAAPLPSSAAAPITTLEPSPVTAPSAPTTGDSTVVIISQGMRGYQVFLDGVYIGTEGTEGDALDGRFSFKVAGNKNHLVRVYDGQSNYPKIMFFEPGSSKTIYVEEGTAAHI